MSIFLTRDTAGIFGNTYRTLICNFLYLCLTGYYINVWVSNAYYRTLISNVGISLK